MKKIAFSLVLILVTQVITHAQSCLPDGIIFNNQAMIDDFSSNYPDCTVIEGSVSVLGNDITNVDGLNQLEVIQGHLYIWENPILNNIEGLSNLTKVGGDLLLSNNPLLSSLNGFNKLDSINGYFILELCIRVSDFSGLEKLTSVGNYLDISLNESLVDLTGLESLESVGADIAIFGNDSLGSLEGVNSLKSDLTGIFIIGNPVLTDLSALHKVSSVTNTLSIKKNDALSELDGLEDINLDDLLILVISENELLSSCEIENICNFISSPNGSVVISENAIGCNTEEEVQGACDASDIRQNNMPTFKLHPKPAKDMLYISSSSTISILKATIYNQFGQAILDRNKPIDKIDVSDLKAGIYIIELMFENLKVRDKIIIVD